MKKIYKISSIVFALALCALAACSKSEIDDVVSRPSGDMSQVKLTFDVKSSPEFQTRAAQSTYYEYLVQNIYIFVFNGDKRVDVSQSFFTSNDIADYKNKQDDKGNNESSGTIRFGSISGSGLKICAIANVGTSNSTTRATANDTGSTTGDVTTPTDGDLKAVFDAITSYRQLKDLSVRLNNNTIMRGASFLMTGEVTADLIANGTTEKTIDLYRTDSKITFNVKAENSEVSDMEFIPGRWRVVNVPEVTYVLPRIDVDNAATTLTENLDATVDEDNYFSVAESDAPQFEGSVGGEENSGTFTFYMYENLQKPTKEIADSDVPTFNTAYEGNLKYALREKQTKTPIADAGVTGVAGQAYVNGDYVYAPKFGTYVVFTGELSYTLDKGTDTEKYVIADVEYCVHLGHGSVDNVNSYNTLRNHHYTYNVTIKGVNSLVVEVDSDNNSDPADDQEERPGAEGDVVISATEIHNVDGHYDRALIKLTALEASDLLFSVSTPFERGVDDMKNDAELKDYKWIKFLVNSEVGADDDEYAAYPGDDCYDGGASATGAGEKSNVYGKTVVLRDIRQLSNYFRANNPSGDVYITAFVDEYLYFYDPTTDNVVTNGATTTTYKSAYTATDAKDLLMWKRSVNQNDRMLHIVKAGDMKYSKDGETSVSRSVVTFKQRPILTFYNVGAEGLTTAWGTETINETPKMTVTRNGYPSTDNYNYVQQAQRLTAYRGKNIQYYWADVISSTEQYGLGSSYQDPSYACALRNRDFDGDGEIDQNEVQWYLAALDQMSDLWIGEPAMPKYAHLYDEENPDGNFLFKKGDDSNPFSGTHYITSEMSGDGTLKVYWAEEYGANSSFYQSVCWAQAPMKEGNGPSSENEQDNWNDGKSNAIVSLRCVRNLGMIYTSTSIPQHYIQTESVATDEGTVTRLKLDYINPIALRTVTDNGDRVPISTLNSNTENNRPYGSFDVYPGMLTYRMGYYDMVYTNYWYQYLASERDGDYDPHNASNDGRICPEGWRVPTQREMLIMSNNVTSGWYNVSWSWATMINYQLVRNNAKTQTQIGAFYLDPNMRMSRSIGGVISENVTEDTANLVRDYLYNENYTPTAYSAAVRCVRDNLDYTPQNAASTYNNGGSAVE